MSEPRLIVGLGNPGPRYARNRHNIGFRAVEEVAEAHHLSFSRREHRALTAHGWIGEQRVILVKLQTWMNESGLAVAALARFYRLAPQAIFVLHDDLDLPLGTLRFRSEGSSGGHRGVQSIIERLGSSAFPRLRLGIGRPPGRMDPAAYVLQDFSQEEEPRVWEVLRLARRLTEDWLQGGKLLSTRKTWRIETPDL